MEEKQRFFAADVYHCRPVYWPCEINTRNRVVLNVRNKLRPHNQRRNNDRTIRQSGNRDNNNAQVGNQKQNRRFLFFFFLRTINFNERVGSRALQMACCAETKTNYDFRQLPSIPEQRTYRLRPIVPGSSLPGQCNFRFGPHKTNEYSRHDVS